MALAKLLDQPSDYTNLGVNPEKIEMWEDGHRDSDKANHWEWWYFDSILDDGTAVVVQFLTKSGRTITGDKYCPTVFLKITLPDGTHYEQKPSYKAGVERFGEEQCDVCFGDHTFKGDLQTYHIHVEPIKGLGADLTLTSLSKPYRPGTAYFEFGNPDKYYTWLCVVPKGEVSGTIVIDGKPRQVHGLGYHDHQWGSVNFHKEWNHWLWARQSFDDYSMLVFDMTAREHNGWERFPLVFIQDKDGNIVFENTRDVSCSVGAEYIDEKASGKTYPETVHYTFKNKGKQVDYSLRVKKIIEASGYRNAPAPLKLALNLMGIKPSYSRYLATSELILKDETETINRSGELIYEFMFPGNSYQGHFQND
jgi:predicted secreted hydrolase